jgi:hypothetical protein
MKTFSALRCASPLVGCTGVHVRATAAVGYKPRRREHSCASTRRVHHVHKEKFTQTTTTTTTPTIHKRRSNNNNNDNHHTTNIFTVCAHLTVSLLHTLHAGRRSSCTPAWRQRAISASTHARTSATGLNDENIRGQRKSTCARSEPRGGSSSTCNVQRQAADSARTVTVEPSKIGTRPAKAEHYVSPRCRGANHTTPTWWHQRQFARSLSKVITSLRTAALGLVLCAPAERAGEGQGTSGAHNWGDKIGEHTTPVTNYTESRL